MESSPFGRFPGIVIGTVSVALSASSSGSFCSAQIGSLALSITLRSFVGEALPLDALSSAQPFLRSRESHMRHCSR